MARPAADVRPILAWFASGLTLAVVAAAACLAFINLATFQDFSQANFIEIILPIGFAIVGGLVASRQSANPMGWLFLAIALSEALLGLTEQYTRFVILTEPGAPFSAWIPWIGVFTANLVYPAGLAALGLLLTPNGSWLSDRWRPVAWAGVAVTAAAEVTTLLDPNLVTNDPRLRVANPTGIPALTGISSGAISVALFLGGLAILAAAGVSVVIRLRRAVGDERLQLRWVAYAAAFSVVISVVGALEVVIVRGTAGGADPVATATTVVGFGMALPASFGVAILRYRLYDLDLLLNRTLVYGAASLVLALAVVVADVLLQRAMETAFHQRSELVSVGLGLAAGVAFGPLRRRVRRIVDRFLPARSRQTLLFTDIVASTQALVDLGDERWRELLEQFRATVRRELARFHGREVNTAGDAFFAAFDRPLAAVLGAGAIRDAVQRLGLRVRVGLHVGDVEMRGEQMSGLAVHAAARIMGEAADDQILVSGELADLLGDRLELHDAGEHALKGVPGEWRLFAVGSTSSGA